MSAKTIADDVAGTLRNNGVNLVMTVREGTWTDPATIGFEHQGQKHHLQFWPGSHTDKRIAEAVYDDVLAIITSSPVPR